MTVLDFITLDVFTTTRYIGNPLAIVHIPAGSTISQAEKQKIAAEFNLSETVFIHDLKDPANVEGNEVQINIFVPNRELPFAGHPTIGAGFHLLSTLPSTTSSTSERSTTLITLAGKIPVTYSAESGLTRLQVPHAFEFHNAISRTAVAAAIGLSSEEASRVIIPNAVDGSDNVAVVAVVEGMTFGLVQIASVEALSKTRATGIIPASGDQSALDMLYLYCLTNVGAADHVNIRSRMFFDGNIEDPATGSGASCLCGFLSMTKANDLSRVDEYYITQGVEMGRKSEIRVDVKSKPRLAASGRGEVETMWLSGKCVQVMQGTLKI